MSLQAEITKEEIASASRTSGRRRDMGDISEAFGTAAEQHGSDGGTRARHSRVAAWSVNSQFMTPFRAFVS